jgi:hypothetical protein
MAKSLSVRPIKQLKKLKQLNPVKENTSKSLGNSYFRYRWFMTSNKRLVIGGKSAEQNEEIVSELLKSGKNYAVMHTQEPGSPFAVIQSDSYNEKDLEETAIFTACFSRAWREKKKEAIIDVFKAEQIYKKKSMKSGTFGVSGDIERMKVFLKLYLTEQEGVLRAVPFKVSGKNVICIVSGPITKEHFAEQISIKLDVVKDEVLQALPTGGFKICSL